MLKKITKILALSLGIFLLGFVVSTVFYEKPASVSRFGTSGKNAIAQEKSTVPTTDKSILLVGMPGPGNPAPHLTDTISTAFIRNNHLTLISIPRDLLVKIPNTRYVTRINSLYSVEGIEGMMAKAKEILGIEFQDYVIINLKGLAEIIDELGGVNILVEKNIYDPAFPGPNYSYKKFSLKSGWRWLDGETALKFVRSRHNPSGDFDRIKRQQQLLEAIKKKVLSLNPVWNFASLLSITQKADKNMEASFGFRKLYKLFKDLKNIPSENIHSYTIEGKLLKSQPVVLGGKRASTLVPKEGQGKYEKIHKFVENVLTTL